MLIGASSAGKTTLIQRLQGETIHYQKTQATEYTDEYIDTVGEYVQVRTYWQSLTTISHDADIICLVHDSSDDNFWFSAGIATKFSKPVIGIVTKTDKKESNTVQAIRYLELAGCKDIYCVSAFNDEGMNDLYEGMQSAIDKYKTENEHRYRNDYFD